MSDKYCVDLTAAEQEYLGGLLKQGKASARKIARAHLLLQAAEGLSDEEIADTLRVGLSPIHRTRQRFVEEGVDPALSERRRAGVRQKLAGKQEAFLVALPCSTPPAGRARWTMQLLADRLVELSAVAGISDETVRRALKKTRSTPGNAQRGAFPVSVRPLSGTWKMSWTCMPSPMMRAARKSVSTRVRCN